jgi:hypothetical protein
MMSKADAQRLLDQQAQAYQGQINDLNTNLNVMVNQAQAQQQQEYYDRVWREAHANNPFR